MKSRELLAHSECRTAVLDAAIDAVVTADAGGRIVEYNPAAERMFGWSHAEARGRRLDEMLVPPEVPAPTERLRPLVPLPDGETRRAPVELTLLHKDGTRIPVAAIGARTTIDGDQILVSFFHDLSAERAAEKRFQTLVETLPLAVYRESIGDGFGTTYASPQVESIAGYPPERWTDDPYFYDSLIETDDLPRVLAGLAATREHGVPFHEEFRLRAADGRTVWVEDHAVVVTNEGGPVLQGYILDITERKNVVIQHAETEAKYRSLVEHLPLVTYTNAYQESVETLYMSPQVKAVVGYAPDEWCSHPVFFESILHPDDREDVLTRVAEAHVSGDKFSGDYRLIARDGRTVWIRDESQPVAGPNGAHLVIQGFFIDITERKRLELAVVERTHDLEQAVARLQVSEEETIVRLSRAAEIHDEITGFHIERMAAYCGLLARLAGIDDERAELIRLASTLHDIGKIGVPSSILVKPGPLTAAERRLIDEHTLIGHRMLAGSTSPLLELAATIALTHHEHFDGAGKPHGVAGDAIAIEGRIAAVADVFDALLSDRPYRRALPIDQVVAELRRSAGNHLDQRLVELFLGSIDEVARVRAEVESRGKRWSSDAPLG